MKRKRKPIPFSRILLLCIGEALLLGALWKGTLHQYAAMNQAVNDIAELKDPSPFRTALMGHLGKIRLALQGFLRSSDPSLAEQVSQSRQDFDASLPQFEKENPRLFPQTAVEEIRRSFDAFEASIDRLLEANKHRAQSRGVLDSNFTQIIYLIEHDIKPLIRKEQLDAEERKEAILNIKDQARAWQQNLAKAWAQPSPGATEASFENDNRGGTYLVRYGRLELLRRERKLQKEIAQLWKVNSDLARESVALEQTIKQDEMFMDSQHAAVVVALSKYLPAMPPAELQARKQRYFRVMRLHAVMISLLVLAGLVSLRSVLFGIYRLLHGEPFWKKRPPPPLPATETIAPGTTLQMDLNGRIMIWTDEAEILYGYTPEEIRGQSISMLFESESEISRLYKDLLDAPQTAFETIHKFKSGQPVTVRIEFRPVVDTGGRVTAIGLVCKPT